METIVQSRPRRATVQAVLLTVIFVPLSTHGFADTASEEAFRARQTDFLQRQNPDRVRIDRPQSAPITKIDGIEPQAIESGTEVGEPQRASLSVSINELAAALEASKAKTSGILDFWIEGHLQPYEVSDRDGNMSVMYAGTKYMLGPDIMVGALAQFDNAMEFGSKASMTANGWMTGPYTSVRFGPGIVFDGRAAWGTSETDGTYLEGDGGTSERRLVRGTLRGTKQVGGWMLTPSVGMTYVEDRPMGSASLAGSETAAPIGEGRLEVLPELKKRFSVNETMYVEPRAAAGGFVSFDDLSELNHTAPFSSDVQMKAEAGLAVGIKDGLNVEAKGGVETGATPEAPDTWSGRLQLKMPLNK